MTDPIRYQFVWSEGMTPDQVCHSVTSTLGNFTEWTDQRIADQHEFQKGVLLEKGCTPESLSWGWHWVNDLGERIEP